MRIGIRKPKLQLGRCALSNLPAANAAPKSFALHGFSEVPTGGGRFSCEHLGTSPALFAIHAGLSHRRFGTCELANTFSPWRGCPHTCLVDRQASRVTRFVSDWAMLLSGRSTSWTGVHAPGVVSGSAALYCNCIRMGIPAPTTKGQNMCLPFAGCRGGKGSRIFLPLAKSAALSQPSEQRVSQPVKQSASEPNGQPRSEPANRQAADQPNSHTANQPVKRLPEDVVCSM